MSSNTNVYIMYDVACNVTSGLKLFEAHIAQCWGADMVSFAIWYFDVIRRVIVESSHGHNVDQEKLWTKFHTCAKFIIFQ